MHTAGRGFLVALLLAAGVTGCGSMLALHRPPDAARKTFVEADALLAAGRYDAAISAYEEFIRHYPTSNLADDAYLRIVHVLLYRASDESPWPDVSASRDTLDALIRRFPDSDRMLEARNLRKVVGLSLDAHAGQIAARDSLVQRLYEQQSTDARVIQLRADRARLTEQIRELEVRIADLRNDVSRRDAAAGELEAELQRVRGEADRMRRILRDLERRDSGS